MGKIYQKIKAKVKQAYHAIKPYVKSILKQGAEHAVAKGGEFLKGEAKSLYSYAKPKLEEGGKRIFHYGKAEYERMKDDATRRIERIIPSMAAGGIIVHAPARIGKVVRLHKGELVIPARKVRGVMRALRKSKIEIPISRRV